MSIPNRIQEFLEAQGVEYEWLPHPEAFSGQEVAHSLHISGKRLAKTVVLDSDGCLMMAVLPAASKLDLKKLRDTVGSKRLEMLPESELTALFPDCEVGAIPPLGNLYGMEVWLDRSLAEREEFVFTVGTHRDAVLMPYVDFRNLVKPHLGNFSQFWQSAAA